MIRSATKKDLKELIELGKILTDHEQNCDPYLKGVSKQDSLTHYSKELNNSDAKFFVYELDGEIVGYIYGYIKKAPDHIKIHQNLGHLEACVVKKEHRGKRISSGLAKALLEWFKENNISLIELGVYAGNESVKVWEKLGFKSHHITMRSTI